MLRLIPVAGEVPATIVLQCEQIMYEAGKREATRMIALMLPFLSHGVDDCTSQASQLVVLRTIAMLVKHLSSAQLIELISDVAGSVCPFLNHSLVDIRQAVIVLLVEMYAILGEGVYSYIRGLTPPQKKLLTIYIEKRISGLAP